MKKMILLNNGGLRSVLVVSLLSAGTAFAQTANCNDNAAGQLPVGTTCNPQPFNTQDNVNWWNPGSANFGMCAELFGDAWMWFDATSTSTTITYDPLVEDAVLTIFQGACNSNGPSVACSDVGGYGGVESITLTTIPGTRYHIRIENYWGNTDMAGTVCATSVGGGGGPTTASDCPLATNICTNLSFSIDPNGYGTVNEIPASGTTPGNPSTNPFSANMGCLLNGEYNSTWMIVNVATTGNLEFTFGGGGSQAGYFDWIMYPYNGPATCAAITANTVAPVRCNWNLSSSGGTGLNDVVPPGGNAGNYEPPLPVTAGQRYIICFSNWSNLATTVPLDFVTGPGNANVSCTPLGFALEGLSVECYGDYREVAWKGPYNSLVEKYVVEKSRDNVNWQTLGTVYNGELIEGNTIEYAFVDETDPSSLEYYRVKEYLTSGEMVPSDVISSDCDAEGIRYRLYPNPSTGLMSLEYESATDATIEFYDMYGKLMYSTPLERTMTPKTVQIRAENVPEGMYMYRLTLSEGTKTGSIVIRH